MKFVISGANGFIGSRLVNKLFESGYNVIGIVRNSRENVDSIKGKCKLVFSELEDLNISDFADGDQDVVVYHLAWQGVNGKEKGDQLIQIKNIEMGLAFAKFASRIQCKKFLCAGTIAEESVKSFSKLSNIPASYSYAIAKFALRNLIKSYFSNKESKQVWMQFSNVYGPSNKTGNLISYTLDCLLKGQEAKFGPANQPYDFIYLDDLIQAIYKLGTTDVPNDFYFLGSGKPRLLKDYLNEIGTISNRPELIKIGERPDDGIEYTWDMFDNKNTVRDLGNYVSGDFEKHIKYTISEYLKG